jgi:hypothetical protein
MRKLPYFWFGLLVLLPLALRCGSQSVTEMRFDESNGLPTPVLPAPADPRNFSFAVVGDIHAGDTARLGRIVTAANAENDAFLILLGDIVDQGDRASLVAVRSLLAQMGWQTRTLPVIGNHDIFNDGWTAYKELWGPSHFSLSYGNSKFIALDTADGTVGGTQADWFRGELRKSALEHVFVLSHYLPIVPGQRTYLRLSNEIEAARLMKSASDAGVTAWLGGHYHSYLNGVADGVSYVVAGGGGGRRMDPVRDYFFVQVQVAGPTVTYQLRIVP